MPEDQDIQKPITWVDFLQTWPPESQVKVQIHPGTTNFQGTAITSVRLWLHCPSDSCNGYRWFSTRDELDISQSWRNFFLRYTCQNCVNYSKMFCVGAVLETLPVVTAYKFGEYPPFGPPTPSRVIELIGPDREIFLQGRRSENRGLGIGAFTYYRRVVENQWTRLVEEVIKVAKRLNMPPEMLISLEEAKNENQFDKAVKSVKESIPPQLLINGHNPLTLLHNSLSLGVHALSDAECLELATHIRTILAELAEKIGSALKEERQITDAVSKLLNARNNKTRVVEPPTDAPA